MTKVPGGLNRGPDSLREEDALKLILGRVIDRFFEGVARQVREGIEEKLYCVIVAVDPDICEPLSMLVNRKRRLLEDPLGGQPENFSSSGGKVVIEVAARQLILLLEEKEAQREKIRGVVRRRVSSMSHSPNAAEAA